MCHKGGGGRPPLLGGGGQPPPSPDSGMIPSSKACLPPPLPATPPCLTVGGFLPLPTTARPGRTASGGRSSWTRPTSPGTGWRRRTAARACWPSRPGGTRCGAWRRWPPRQLRASQACAHCPSFCFVSALFGVGGPLFGEQQYSQYLRYSAKLGLTILERPALQFPTQHEQCLLSTLRVPPSAFSELMNSNEPIERKFRVSQLHQNVAKI